ncbi:MAG: phage integrase N-terminal SAM-like domain-containing protein [Nitrosomonas sp.]
MNDPPKLLDRVRGCIRARHYSIRTENSYIDWARRFILFHGKRQLERDGSVGSRSIFDTSCS